MTQEANDREYRVIDQLISMHADIAQSRSRRATILSAALLFTSAVMCAFTFADDATMALFQIGAAHARFVRGIISATAFGLSIVLLKVDWPRVAQAHLDAAKRLSTLKSKYRAAYSSLQSNKEAIWAELSREYAETLDSIAQVPERQFAHLKARHLFKKTMSVTIDSNPGVPVAILALAARLRAVRGYLSRRDAKPT